MAKYVVSDFRIGGIFDDWFWDYQYNPNATISNGLANCTTLAVGLTYVNKLPYPVSSIPNASNFHNNLINGWTYTKFKKDKVKVGDILEWSNHCHVATVADIIDGTIYVHSSWYTGEHGVSVWDGKFDTRKSISSLQQLSDFMYTNYPYRMYHYTDLETECSQVGGGYPQFICVAPNSCDIHPVEEDKSVNQIQVLTDCQNIRNNPNGDVIGVAQSGFYNVYETYDDDYVWYKVSDEQDAWIAGVNGRVIYVPAMDDIKKLKAENKKLKMLLKEIHEMTEGY